MLCVLRTLERRMVIEWSAGPWKAEVDLHSEEDLLRKAQLVDGRWPLTHGAFRHILPLYDPEGVFSRVCEATHAPSDEAYRAAIEDVLVGDLYEHLGKIRNDVARGWTGMLAFWVMDMVKDITFAIALSQRHCFTSGTRMLEEALDLPDQPAGFAPLARLVMTCRLHDTPAVLAACEALWSGIAAWAAAHGFSIVSASRIPI
jgi:kanamycin nucleotidyltransferase